MKLRRFVIAAAVFLTASTSTALGEANLRGAALPERGVLVGGVSLGGVRLGDSPAAVELMWGTNHTRCEGCRLLTWFYVYPDRPVGAAVTFDRGGRAVAVFTLGQTPGWHTQKGLWVGAEIHSLTAKYDAPNMEFRECIGYRALSTRSGDVVTSIYTQAESVYGFALTSRGRPVCQ